jgi:protein SCO1/2
MFKNLFLYLLIPATLLGFVYYMMRDMKPTKKNTLPIFGIDSVAGTDTIYHKVGDFSFTSQEGKTITQKDFENTVYVADFFFIKCPGICKDMAAQMRRVYKAYENNPNVKILSHTVDPQDDSVTALMDYAKIQGVKDHNKWIMVTGNKKELYDMARICYYSTATQGDGGPDDFVHTERFVLVDKEKYIRGFYDGTNENEVNKMMFDMDKLLKEYKD